MPQLAKSPDERAPLLAVEPTTVDASNEIIADEDVPESSKGISVSRGVACVFALGCLIFLQGKLTDDSG